MTNLLLIAMCLVIAFLLYHAWHTEQKVNQLELQCAKMCDIDLANTSGVNYLLNREKYNAKKLDVEEERISLIEYQFIKEGPKPSKDKIFKMVSELIPLSEDVVKAHRAYKQALSNVKSNESNA